MKENSPNLVQVLPELHLAGVGADLVEIRPQERLAVQHLRAVLVGDLVHGPLEARAARLERARGDVVLQQLAVDDGDDGGDERLDVLRAGDQRLNVSWWLLLRG